jgi:hypothetical protein
MVSSAEQEVVHLATEDEAWDFLKQLMAQRVSFERIPKLELGEWAKLDVNVPEKRYDSAITPSMMKGWVELQLAIYRAYSISQGGEAKATSLSEREKEKLELIVNVTSGSSDQKVDIQEIIESFISNLVDNMGPEETLIAVISLILSITGASVLKSWLVGRKEIKLAEIESIKTREIIKGHQAALDTIAQVAGVDLERKELIKEIKKQYPIVRELEDEVARGREAMVKHLTKDDAYINGVFIKSEAGKSISSTTRTESVETRLDGLYTIRKVDTTVSTGFRVHLSDKEGNELVADLAELFTTLSDRKVIQDAEWKKVPAFFQINAKSRRDEPIEAIIVRARAYEPETDGPWP